MNDTAARVRKIYNLGGWGENYVDVNAAGNLCVRPYRDAEKAEIDLAQLITEIKSAGMTLPVLVRFQQILRDRVDQLSHAFRQAFSTHQYHGRYTAVYPIKVNQQHSVVSEIIQHGGEHVGLEAGSKPELMAVLSLANEKTSTIICNGYKDNEYIRLALIGVKLGYRVYIVIEKPSELQTVMQEAADLDVEPLLGLRVRLSSIGKGKWQNTGGDYAKFGLSLPQLMDISDQLIQHGKQSWVKLLHFHMGSQIANLNEMQQGFSEAARFYVELVRSGFPMGIMDLGGGIGVDYEGTHSRSDCSINYRLEEYASMAVAEIQRVCRQQAITEPDLITEAGRAMTAHHAVLITNVTGTEYQDHYQLAEFSSSTNEYVNQVVDMCAALDEYSVVESYQRLLDIREQVQQAFVHNELALAQRSEFEKVYLAACHEIRKHLTAGARTHRDLLDELNQKLADKYFCNFSLFQSVPDIWGIDQIFPIVPLQRLDEMPQRRAILQDLTCDSDGQIKRYVDNYGIESTLPIHAIDDHEEYLLGIFMVGAYQEILGDMHNLFGDTDAINVELTNDGYRLTNPERGDTVLELLNYVHFDAGDMLHQYKQKIARADLSAEQRDQFMEELKAGLNGYTYLE